MAYAQFRMPQAVYYGKGALAELGNEAAKLGSKALLISDRVMEKLGNVQQCMDILERQGVVVATYLDVNAEPTDVHVAEAVRTLRTQGCDLIVALGGGSCIDAAKAVSVIGTEDDTFIADLAHAAASCSSPIPVVAIPTTAGTGSEVTYVTVIIHTANDVKMMIKHPSLMPAVAIADPLLTLSSPAHVTAATGIDALCHAVEAFISRRAQPMTDDLALGAIRLIAGNIRTAYEDGQNIEAREKMMLAATQAGIAFSNASVTLVHGMSRPIGALFHVPHGLSNAMLLPVVLDFTRDHALNRLAAIGRYLYPELTASTDEALADQVIGDLKRLCRDLSIPNLRDYGINKTAFDEAITKMAADAIASGSPANHPRVPSADEIAELYRQCYDYEFSEL